MRITEAITVISRSSIATVSSSDERRLPGRVPEQGEVAGVLADVPLVEDDLVVAEVAELELRDHREDRTGVVRLLEDAEGQNEDRVVGVDRSEAVVAALVDKTMWSPKSVIGATVVGARCGPDPVREPPGVRWTRYDSARKIATVLAALTTTSAWWRAGFRTRAWPSLSLFRSGANPFTIVTIPRTTSLNREV